MRERESVWWWFIKKYYYLGLEDQLLGRVIVTEKKELEIERTNLITGVTANKRKMKELEANLLHKLSTVEVINIKNKNVCGDFNKYI